MKGIRKFVIGLLFISLIIGTVQAAAPAFESIIPSDNPSTYLDEIQEFSVTTDQTVDFTWYIDEIPDGSTSSSNVSSYSNGSASVGEHNVTVIIENANGTNSTKWTWTVNTPPPPSIINSDPSDDRVYTYNGSSQSFSIDINQTVNVTWYLNETLVDYQPDVTTSSYSNSSPIGDYNVTVIAENKNGTDSRTWIWSVIPIPPPSITRTPSSDPESHIGQNQTFSITIDQPVNITWLINGTEVKNETLKTSSIYSNSTAPIGVYNVTVNVENANGTNSTTWTWYVVPIPVEITNSAPSSPASTLVDETITFSIDINQTCDVEWFIDSTSVQQNSSVTSASFTASKSSTGTYTVKVVATNTTTSESDFYEWTWKVNPKTYYSGNRIWDTSMSTTYTWTPQSFSGFYYDLDTNEGSETLTIYNIRGSLSRGDIVYETSPISVKFEHENWGTYNVIGFMADRYFAGYTSSTTFASSDDSLLSEKQLSKVLMDTDKKYTVQAGTPLELKEGYDFRITEFGTSGDAVMVGLFKDGGKVVDDIVSEGDTFVYKKDLGGARDIPIIAINIDTVFIGTETSRVVIEGIFQISENYIDVDTGEEFGLMEIKSVSSSGITMKNDNTVSFGRGDDFNLMGKINIVVADDSTLRFAPYVDMTEPGTYELRGTVTDDTSFTWTPLNFEGLLYDIDTGFGDETLQIERSGRTVNSGDLTYTTRPISVGFEHSGDGWGTYQSIGFMGETYFAGYESTSSFVSDDRSLLKQGRLSKILMDEDKKYTLRIGNSLPLQDGYSLRIDEISRSGDALMLALLKDGIEKTTDIVSEDDTFIYEIEVGDTDIPIIIAHIDNIFRGMETNSVFIDGIFQISDSFTTVDIGDSYGKMKITTVNKDEIKMTNDDSLSLGRGDTIDIMGNIKFKVADDSDVRFYPFEEIVVEEPLYLELDIPNSVYQNEQFTIKVTSDGDEVEDAIITFGDFEIGTTDSSGELTYTPDETGTFTITASRSGYESDSEEIDVLYQPKVLEISAPQVVDRGETIVISVTSEGSGVSGASVMFGSKDLGTTPSSGNITYTPDEIGTFTITASKSGYQDASRDIDITDPAARLVFSNLSVKPKRVQPEEPVNITVEAANFGTLREAETVSFKINGKEEATVDLALGPGEITTLLFTVNKSKPGTYKVEVDGRSDTFRVMGDELGTTGLAVLGIIVVLFTTAIIYSIAQGTLTFSTIAGKAQAFERMLRRLVEK